MKKLFALILSFASFNVLSAPQSVLWPYWNSSQESSTTMVDHQAWQTLLDRYLIKEGDYALFRYAAVNAKDSANLSRYIETLSQHDPLQLSQAQQYAYWVNLYNAITVSLIIDAYPIKSITKLGGLFSFGPWEDEVVTINGKALTLNDIEHRILRPIWNDPRTHYAVNCASLGCPNLQSQAFTAENSERLLEQAAKEFINADKGVLELDKRIQLSSIYEWFADDFGNTTQLKQHINRYRFQPLSSLENVDYEYDWSLNEKK